jgi:hypothetical protein
MALIKNQQLSQSYVATPKLTFSQWLEDEELGDCVLANGEDDLPALLDKAPQMSMIAIAFEAFTDGRGFSMARMLRRAGYQGEIRAVGDVAMDRIDFMQRVGFNAFELPVTIARPFNTYGPRQSARAVIPTIITQIASGAKEIKLGDISPTRDFSYVEDTCRGFLAIIDNDQTIGETINIGSNFEISIGDTLNLVKELMNSDVEFVVDENRIRPSKSEVFRLWCDNSKIKELTGFKPQINIKEGLQKTIDWITQPDNLKKYKSEIYNV